MASAFSASSSGSKFDIMKFDGKNNFALWQVRVKALLVREDLHDVLLGKAHKDPEVSDCQWEKLDLKALSTIQLCLSDDMLYSVLSEKMITYL